jgi:hypothetical protein
MDNTQRQADAEQTETLRLANLQNDYRRVFMSDEAGLRVLEDLFAVSRPFEDPFFGNSRDIFQKGRRQLGLHILDRLGMNTMPGAVRLMIRLGSIDPQAMQELAGEREAVGAFIKQCEGIHYDR